MARLERPAATIDDDDDPTFARWAKMAKEGGVPDEWWGPAGKDPVALAKLRAKIHSTRRTIVREK